MRRSWGLTLAALVLCVGAGATAGYALAAHRSNVSVLTGTFYVGDREASATVDGWAYGINNDVGWLGSNDSWHDAGWPECLGPVGTTHTVRFGYTTVDGPTTESWRQVVWVSCLS
jgi:hypothetical protein